jgi:hypothetical protein
MTLNGKDLKGKGRSPIEVLYENLLGWTEERHEITSVRMANVPEEIRMDHLPNIATPISRVYIHDDTVLTSCEWL